MAKSSATKKSSARKTQSFKKNSAEFQPQESKIAATSAESDDGLQNLFLDSLKDIYWAENHLVKSLPKLINGASSPALQSAINDHLEVTEEHVSRIEEVFKLLGKKPQAKKCDAMEGLSKEGEGVIESTYAGTKARDHGIIMASQKTEHYEIAAYRGLAKLAGILLYDKIVEILERTLAEEQKADDILTTLADDLIGDYVHSSKELQQ